MDITLLNLIKSSEIFSHLNEDQLKKLIQSMQLVKIAAGEILFEKGTPSDSLYIVTKGMLEAVSISSSGEEILGGTIRSGQTVGEMGVLSSQPRCFTIRAIRNSILLKLTKSDFESYYNIHPQILTKLIKPIIIRSEQTVQKLTATYCYTNILILSANASIDLLAFTQELQKSDTHGLKITYLKMSDFYQKRHNQIAIHEYLDQIELDNDYVISTVDIEDKELFDTFLERTDRIVVVAMGNETVNFNLKIKDELNSPHLTYLKKDLVLLHPENTTISQTKSWLEPIHFSHFYHITIQRPKDYERVLRFLTNKATGLVISGGSMQGLAAIGALKAFSEARIEIDAVGGTSVGSILGGGFIHSSSFDSFYQKIKEGLLSLNNIIGLNNITYPLISITDGKLLTHVLLKYFGDQQIEDLIKPFFCVSYDMTKAKQVVHTQGPLWQWIRASASLPVVLPPVTFESHVYVDGGFVNNLPTDIMRNYLDGRGRIIAVNTLIKPLSPAIYQFPPILSLLESLFIKFGFKKYKHYVFPKFMDFINNSFLMGGMEKISENCALADVLIQIDTTAYDPMKLTIPLENLIEIGYKSAMSQIDSLIKK